MNYKKITLKIIDECNLLCPYCFAEEDRSQKRVMSFEDFKWILQFCINNEVNIGITGGEPFLHPHIYQFINAALEKNIGVMLYSNLTVRDCVDKMNDLNSGHKVSILINVNDYEFYTGEQFESFYENIIAAQKQGIHLHLSYNVYKLPINIEHAFALAKQYGIKRIRISQTCPNFSHSNKSLGLAEIPAYLKNLVIIAKQMEQAGIQVNADCPVPNCLIDKEDEGYLIHKVRVRSYCGERLGVYPDLTIGQCFITQKMINQRNLKDFSYYQDAINFIRGELDLVNQRQVKLKSCWSCDFLKDRQCSGGCYGLYEWNYSYS